MKYFSTFHDTNIASRGGNNTNPQALLVALGGFF